MNRSLIFFFWTVWSSEALAAGASASTPDPRGPDCVARAWRRLRSFGVAERSKRKARDGGARGAAPLSVPRMLRHGRDVPRRSGNIGFPAVGRFRRAAERPPARRRGARGSAHGVGSIPRHAPLDGSRPACRERFPPSRCPMEFPRGRRTRSRCRRMRSLGTQPAYTRRRIEFVPSCSADATCLPSHRPA